MPVRLRRARPATRDSATPCLQPPVRRTLRRGLVGLALLAGVVARAATTIICPPILVETPIVQSMLAGWEVDVRAGRRTLADAAIQVSRGSDRGGVTPDTTNLSGHHETSTWSLSPGDGSVYWVACSYGNTSALLLQKVPETAHRCVASVDVLNTGRRLNVRPITCD
ncbi:MAG: STY0301 family protein [Burkholderiaceae bacterium]|jgi:hypothetical protein